MSGKKKSAAQPNNSTPQTDMPSLDTAAMAANKALDAREGARSSMMADEEQAKRPAGSGLAQTAQRPRPQRRRERDPASMADGAATAMVAPSAVLTG